MLASKTEWIGGDDAGMECSKCESRNTIFEEWADGREDYPDSSELGIKCQDCDYVEEPDSFNQRFEPVRDDDIQQNNE
jgi:hypothetical protein